jgi:hypothetical protein
VPQGANGQWYVFVQTDAGNAVYEYSYEDNNITGTAPITVVLRPAPNLIITDATIPADTVSNRQPVTLRWKTVNNSAVSAFPNWTDQVYLSADNIFSENTDIKLSTYTHTDTLESLDVRNIQQTAQIPATLPAGNYYLLLRGDEIQSATPFVKLN